MTRLSWHRSAVIVMTVVALLGLASGEVAHAGSPPSVVVILTDDQRWSTLRQMPTVMRDLVAQGLRFTNAFASTPACCPSRATLLTGMYAHHTGVWRNDGPDGGFGAFDDRSTIATWLNAAGYRTAHIGKYLNGYGPTQASYVPPGWDVWQTFTLPDYLGYQVSDDGVTRWHGTEQDQYSTDVLAKHADEFIRETRATRPLLLWFAPLAPHEPATPAARHVGAYAGIEPFRSRAYNERDVTDKPAWVQAHGRWHEKRRSQIDALRQRQLETLLAADEAVAAILDALRDTDRLHNTIVVFASDNGFMWGEHRLFGKYAPYDESIRIPFVLRWDALEVAPRALGDLVVNADLAPTLADLAGVKAPRTDGLTLRPLLSGDAVAWRHLIPLEHLVEVDHHIDSYCGVRTDRDVFVRYESGEEEFYRVRRDPYQRKNRASEATWTKRVNLLRDRTRRLCDPRPPGMPAF
jgi:N-acetylglucosamine-6-sulfatase